MSLMARHLLLMLLLLLSPAVKAQYVDLSDGEQILYTGKPNVLRIPDFDRVVIVKAKYGWVQALESKAYVIYEPYRRPPTADTITVRSKTGVLLKQKVFKVASSPCALFQLGNLTADTVAYSTDSNFLNSATAAIINGTAKFRIISFYLSVKSPRIGYEGPFSSDSGRLSGWQKNCLRMAGPRSTMYIDHVVWDCGGCGEFIHPMSLNQKIFLK
jgi:hypothetical protein